MKKALLSLAVAGMALSIAHSASAQIANPTPGGQTMRTVFHPASSNSTCRNAGFPISEAYFAQEVPFSNTNQPRDVAGNTNAGALTCLNIQRNNRYTGVTDAPDGSPNITAAPGVLAFRTKNSSTSSGELRQRIDINGFATCPNSMFGNIFVQSYRLTKIIPESHKCPATYQAQTFIQFGTNIRTWWPLTYTSPGTQFILELTVRCQRLTFPFDVDLHVDRWAWTVVVTFESLQAVIDLLHENPLGTSEIPCIAAENMYIALKQSVNNIQTERFRALNSVVSGVVVTPEVQRMRAQDQVFNTEALITVFCVFGDCFESTAANPGGAFFLSFPPSNDTQMSLGGAMTGILDTPENPCCCKLLVDIERLAELYNIVSV